MRLLLVLLALALAAPAAAQGARALVVPGAEVVAKAPGPDTLRAAAGGTVGFGVRLDERGGVGHALTLATAAPDGWQPLVTRPSFHLGARGTSLQIVSFQVPADAEAGHYPVTVMVRGAEGWQTSLSKVVEVAPHAALTVVLVGAPRFVVAGEGYTVTALVRNGGNVPAEVAVRAWSSVGSALDPEEALLSIEAGGTAEVPITVETDDREGVTRDRLRVTAVLVGAPAVLDEALATVEVVPRGSAIERTEAAPVVGSLSAVSFGDEVAPLLGLEAAFPLDAEGLERIEVRLDGVGPSSGSVFGRAPEAWARYAGPRGEGFVGTGTFVLSPLTSSLTYGYGASGTLALGRADVAALVRYPWLGASDRSAVDLGLGVGLWTGGWGRLSLNALAATGRRSGQMATARFEVLGLEGLEAEAEAGLAAGPTPRPVYSVRTSVRRGPVAAVAALDRRDAAQPGRFTSSMSGSLAGTLRLGSAASLWGSWRGSQRGEGRLALAAPATEQTVQGGARAAVIVGGVDVRVEAGAERRAVDRGGERRQIALGTGALDVGWRGVKASADVGTGRVRLSDGVLRPAWEARGGLGVRTSALHLNASHTVSQGTSLWADVASRQWQTGVDGAARLGRFGLSGAYTSGRFEVDLGEFGGLMQTATSVVRLEASARLGLGREVALTGYQYRSASTRATHLRATLRVPVPVALPAVPGREEIHGRFVDEATGEGIAGVLVYHGQDRVVTDGDGAFAFATTAAGGYLFLDRATLGADRVPLQTFPLPALPGEPVRVTVAERVALRGALRRLAVYGTGARADTSDVGGLPLAVVEAEGRGQRHRAVTDAEGRFAFDDLPVGTYTLRLVRATLPDRHRLEHETLTVAADGEAEVRWHVVPDRREIRMLGGGGNRLTVGAGGTVRAAPAVRTPAPPAPEETAPEGDAPEGDRSSAERVVVRAPMARVTAPADASAVRPAPMPSAPAGDPVATIVADSPEAEALREAQVRAEADRVETRLPEPPAALREARPTIHRAAPGEHLLSIGRRYRLTEAEIRALNPGLGDHLVVGQPVRLRADAVRPTVHLARPGEHLLAIGRAYGLTEAEVRALNPGLGDHLEVGQPVRVGGAPSLPAAHRVAPGEHLLAIARRYGLTEAEIRALNPGLGDHLEVGQTVRLRSAAGRDVERRHGPGGRW